jgi:hypothetical protein
MNQAFFNRLLHLLNDHPHRGKRMVGMGAEALWELWQRVTEAEYQMSIILTDSRQLF